MIISPAFFHHPHKLFTKTWWEYGHGLSFPSFQNQIRTYHGAVAECVQTQTGSFYIVRQHKRRPLHQKPPIVLMLLSVGDHQKVRRRKPYRSVPKTDCDRFIGEEQKHYLRVLVFSKCTYRSSLLPERLFYSRSRTTRTSLIQA
jgi:hypothetical protein